MSLLVDLWTNSLDPGYAAAARRAPAEPAGRRRSVALAVGVLAAAFVVVVAAEQARVRAPSAARSRADLTAQVQAESKAVDSLTAQVQRLRLATSRLRDAALGGSAEGASIAAQLRAEEIAAATVPVVGPGLRVTLDDAPASPGHEQNRVVDRDLQAVVNALWAAGAEAVAVNGQRLSAQSSIREAGEAVLVNFQPLHAPYAVDAIGDPVGIETAFAQSGAAARMRSYVQLYGLRFGYSRQRSLRLPAAGEEPLHVARPVPGSPTRGGGP